MEKVLATSRVCISNFTYLSNRHNSILMSSSVNTQLICDQLYPQTFLVEGGPRKTKYFMYGSVWFFINCISSWSHSDPCALGVSEKVWKVCVLTGGLSVSVKCLLVQGFTGGFCGEQHSLSWFPTRLLVRCFSYEGHVKDEWICNELRMV